MINLSATLLNKISGFRFCLLIIFALFTSTAFSQVKTDKQSVTEEAKKQLTAMAVSTGELGKACLKNGITGTFVVDITLQGKGSVVTVFMVSSDVEDIKNQNFLKNRITQIAFSDIKIPKKERVKFRHTLTF
jgi:hypothetical protein